MNPKPKQPAWQPVMKPEELKPGTVVRDRKFPECVLTVELLQGRLIRFTAGTWGTVRAAQLYLEFQAA